MKTPTILRATHMGFCFGVRDALAVAEGVRRPERTTIYGELVHNATVNERLADRDFASLSEVAREQMPARPQVLVTAHGISERRRRNLLEAGKELIDTTCPLVTRVHKVAQTLVEGNYFIVVIGKPEHVEVLGITEDLPVGRWCVIQHEAEIRPIGEKRIGIIAQTTMPLELAETIRAGVVDSNPGASVRWVNTVCRPTRQRQSAVDSLCTQSDVVIVVGGENSNNTRRLVERCRKTGVEAFQVESPRQLNPAWLEGRSRIGLTAGTSTPDDVIDVVEEQIRKFVGLALSPVSSPS